MFGLLEICVFMVSAPSTTFVALGAFLGNFSQVWSRRAPLS